MSGYGPGISQNLIPEVTLDLNKAVEFGISKLIKIPLSPDPVKRDQLGTSEAGSGVKRLCDVYSRENNNYIS